MGSSIYKVGWQFRRAGRPASCACRSQALNQRARWRSAGCDQEAQLAGATPWSA